MAEMNGKYLNEEKHQKTKKSIKTIGLVLLIVSAIMILIGIILLIVGISNHMNIGSQTPTDPWDTSMPGTSSIFDGMGMIMGGGFLTFIGFSGVSIGIVLMVVAHRREIMAYTATSVLPVADEVINYGADNIAPAVGRGLGNAMKGASGGIESVVSGVACGIAKGKAKASVITCPNCNNEVKKGAKFCSHCGASLETKKHCPNCGIEIENDAKFCPNCGQKVE